MIEREDHDGVRLLRLAHGRANALDLELLGALSAELGAVAAEARAVVLTGSGTVFSAGVDLVRLQAGGDDYLDRFLPALDDALHRLFALPVPAVAAVNGHAVAGGWILAAACEHRLLAQGRGRVGVPELRVGVPFPLVATEILRAATPAGLFDAFLTGGALCEPDAALAAGLVHAVVAPEELLPRALARARDLCATPPASYARTKADLRAPHLERLAKDGAAHAREVRRLWGSDEVRAAVARHVQATLGK
jgi:enoyl-CoA hydratase